jgi:ABC-type thiamin/hydroxymethylpyrimidine transport system permease subunit
LAYLVTGFGSAFGFIVLKWEMLPILSLMSRMQASNGVLRVDIFVLASPVAKGWS